MKILLFILFITGNISIGEEVNDSTSPKFSHHSRKTILSGNKQIDSLLHCIIDYIIRDFIDSWFQHVSNNTEFNEIRVRSCIEDFVVNICSRAKSAQWLPILTNTIVEEIANHTKFYRIANEVIAQEAAERNKLNEKNLSPQRRSKKNQHKRNKSDTDLSWFTSEF